MSTLVVGCLSAVPGTAAIPPPTENVLSVENATGKAAELLHRLTIPQLAAVLHATPAQLKLQVEALGGVAAVELAALLGNPKATLQEVLDLLAAHGVSTTQPEQLIGRLLAGATETGEQLHATIDEVIVDLREDGQLAQLARELVLPVAVVEAAQLLPTSVERLAGMLGTTTSNLLAMLQGAGATAPSGGTPFVASVVPGGPTTVMVGAPSGSGGLSLTMVNSTPAASASTASKPVSNAFTIVRIAVTSAGVVRETVSLPGPGRVAIKASTRRRLALRSRKGHQRISTRTATLASVGETLSSGVHTLTVRLRGSGSRARPLIAKLSTTYTPSGGSPSTIQRSVTVRRASKKRHR